MAGFNPERTLLLNKLPQLETVKVNLTRLGFSSGLNSELRFENREITGIAPYAQRH